jgi:hypothetical protein
MSWRGNLIFPCRRATVILGNEPAALHQKDDTFAQQSDIPRLPIGQHASLSHRRAHDPTSPVVYHQQWLSALRDYDKFRHLPNGSVSEDRARS